MNQTRQSVDHKQSADPETLRDQSREIAATCAGFNLRRASRAVSQHFDRTLAPVGLRMTQFTLLSALALGGSVTKNGLSHALVIDRTTLTRNLRLLRTAGLVAVDVSQSGREQRLTLTPAGREALARAIPLWRIAQDTLLEAFDEARWPAFVTDLAVLVDSAVGRHAHPAHTGASASRSGAERDVNRTCELFVTRR